jgi:hypothetical protein
MLKLDLEVRDGRAETVAASKGLVVNEPSKLPEVARFGVGDASVIVKAGAFRRVNPPMSRDD